jgi:hypothetical protein
MLDYNPMAGGPVRKGKGHMMTEVENGVRYPPTKEWQGLLAMVRSKER